MVSDTSWKRAERRVAALLGGKRLPAMGRAGPDVVTEGFAIEVKYRKTLPLWLKVALDQARHGSADKIPVVFLAEKGKHEMYVLLSSGDFVRMLGREGCEDRA